MSIPTGWEHTVAERRSLAAENGHGGVVKLLLERGGVSSDGPDGWDQAPPSLAAGNGRGGRWTYWWDGKVSIPIGRQM